MTRTLTSILVTVALIAGALTSPVQAEIATPGVGAFDVVALGGGLSVIDFATNLEDGSLPIVIALVRNETDDPFPTPFVTVAFLDEAGDILTESTLLSFAPVIPPHADAPIFGTVLDEDDAKRASSYVDLEFTPSFGEPEPSNNLARSDDLDISVENVDDSGSSAVSADIKVTNTSDTRVGKYVVMLIVLNDDDRLIGYGYGSSTSGLRAGQSATVSTYLYLVDSLQDDDVISGFAAES